MHGPDIMCHGGGCPFNSSVSSEGLHRSARALMITRSVQRLISGVTAAAVVVLLILR